jgi:flagellar hook-associated protein 3 FlgL
MAIIGPATGTGVFTASLARTLSSMRKSADGLQMQLSTGRKSEDYAGLGSSGSSVSLTLNSKMHHIQTFQSSNETIDLRLKLMTTNITRMAALGGEVKSDADPADFNIISNGQTASQKAARLRLDEMTELLNTDLGGRYLFSGTTTDQRPVEDIAKIMDGDGTRAGFAQIITERQAADTGANGLGRLDTPTVAANVVSLAEDGAHPFGFKLTSATPGTPWATVTGPAGSPATMDITVATQPLNGESIRFTLTQPDGTTKDITLTATTDDPPGEHEFLIGLDADETATNMRDLLEEEIQTAAARSLRAASAVAAGEDFFSSTPPQRVDGVPPETSTGLVAGTVTDTVSWYTGDPTTTDARSSVKSRIDTSMTIGYGARANEDGFTNTLKSIATYAAIVFDPADQDAMDFHAELASRTRTNLDAEPGEQSPETVAVEFGIAYNQLNSAQARHKSAVGIIQKTLTDTQNAVEADVAAQILTLQNRLQASYQVTANLSGLTLVNFL